MINTSLRVLKKGNKQGVLVVIEVSLLTNKAAKASLNLYAEKKKRSHTLKLTCQLPLKVDYIA